MNFLKVALAFSMPRVSAAAWKLYVLSIAYSALSLAEFAALAFVLSVVDIAKVIGDIGAESVLVRKLSNSRRRLRDTTYCLLLARQSLVCIFGIILAPVIYFNFENKNLVFLVLLLVIAPIQSTVSLSIQRTEKYKVAYYSLFLYLSVAALAWGVSERLSLELMLIAPELATATLGVFMIKVNKHFLHIKVNWRKISAALRMVLLRQMHPFMLTAIVILYMRLDVILARPFFGSEVQGEFSMLIRIIEPMFTVMSLLISAYTIWISKQSTTASFANGRLSFATGVNGFFYVVAMPVLLGFSLIHVVPTKAFNDSMATISLLILCASVGIRILNAMLTSHFVRDGKFEILSKAATINMAATVISCCVFYLLRLHPLIVLAAGVLTGEMTNYFFQRHHTLTASR